MNLHSRQIALRGSILSVLAAAFTALQGCDSEPKQSAAPASPPKSAEQIEQEQASAARLAAAADQKLAADSAVRTLLAPMGAVASVTFEEFKKGGNDDMGNPAREISSMFAAEVEASDDLVVLVNEIGWENSDQGGGRVRHPVLRIVAPKGTKLLVTGVMNGKAVAGRHVFQAQQQDVYLAPGVVLAATDTHDGFDPRHALAHARMRSTYKDGVVTGTPEHQQLLAEQRQHEQNRKGVQFASEIARQEKEIADLIALLTKASSNKAPLIIAANRGRRDASWMFTRTLSDVRVDQATGSGTCTITDFRVFPPSVLSATIRKMQAVDRHFSDERPDLFLGIETDPPGEAFILQNILDAEVQGRVVQSLARDNQTGESFRLVVADARAGADMAAWQAAVAKCAEPRVRAASVLDKQQVQVEMQSTSYSRTNFAGARYQDSGQRRVEVISEDQETGGFQTFNGADLVVRAAAGATVKKLLIHFTAGSIAQPEVFINGTKVPGLGTGKPDGGVMVEFETPTTIHEVRIGPRSDRFGMCSAVFSVDASVEVK